MNEKLTRIVCNEPNGNPPRLWKHDCVPHWRVHQIEAPRVMASIEVAGASPHNIEVVSVQVEWVIVQKEHVEVLKHNLHSLVIL